MEDLLTDEYRKTLWEKSKDIVERVKAVLPVSKVTVLGSFTTAKPRPADVDFIVLLQTPDDKEWSADIVFAPDNKHGEDVKQDAIKWMEEKYGRGNCRAIELPAARPRQWFCVLPEHVDEELKRNDADYLVTVRRKPPRSENYTLACCKRCAFQFVARQKGFRVEFWDRIPRHGDNEPWVHMVLFEK